MDEQRCAGLQLIMRDKSLTNEERRLKMEEIKNQYVVSASSQSNPPISQKQKKKEEEPSSIDLSIQGKLADEGYIIGSFTCHQYT